MTSHILYLQNKIVETQFYFMDDLPRALFIHHTASKEIGNHAETQSRAQGKTYMLFVHMQIKFPYFFLPSAPGGSAFLVPVSFKNTETETGPWPKRITFGDGGNWQDNITALYLSQVQSQPKEE